MRVVCAQEKGKAGIVKATKANEGKVKEAAKRAATAAKKAEELGKTAAVAGKALTEAEAKVGALQTTLQKTR